MYKVQKGLYVIAITVVLLCVWLVTAGSVVYAADESAIVLDFNNESDYGSVSFEAKNMFPGDKVSKIYKVVVPDLKDSESATVHFQATVRSGYEKLAEVLQCEVLLAETREVLYTGLMRDMSSFCEGVLYNSKDTYLDYEINVWLDTSVGNEYQGKTLVADFIWWAEETEENVPDVLPEDEVPEDDTSSNEASADDISANNPFTGDTAPIVKYICLMISTVCGLLWIICMIKRRKEYGDE